MRKPTWGLDIPGYSSASPRAKAKFDKMYPGVRAAQFEEELAREREDFWKRFKEDLRKECAEKNLRIKARREQTIRDRFETYYSDEGKLPAAVERSGEGYKLLQAQAAWVVWQAAWVAATEQTK